MAISPISNTALLGIQRGLKGMQKSAAEIASASKNTSEVPSHDMVRAMLEMKQHANHTQASIKAFKTIEQTIGSILDIKA